MPEPTAGARIVGHQSAWGRSPFGAHVRPYQLTPGATDTMRVRVREKIDILGVGTDVVEMEGTFTVRRDHACAVGNEGVVWGKSCVKTEFRALELYGESPVFGTVRVHLDPDQSSHGEVGPAAEGSLAAICVAHCHPTVELPALGMRLTTGGTPIELASKVIQIPPVGDVARGQNSANLVDDNGNVVGELVSSDIEVGEVLWSVPLGDTCTHGEKEHAHAAAGDHANPSGSQFYSRRPRVGTDVHARPSVGASHVHAAPQPAEAGAPGTQAAVLEVLGRLEGELRGLLEAVRSMVRQ